MPINNVIKLKILQMLSSEHGLKHVVDMHPKTKRLLGYTATVWPKSHYRKSEIKSTPDLYPEPQKLSPYFKEPFGIKHCEVTPAVPQST